MRALLSSCLLLAFSAFVWPAASNDGLQAYRDGDFARALPLLSNVAATNPNDPVIAAALLSSAVYQGQLDRASDLVDDLAARFPNSPEAIAGRGEAAYYMGDLGKAETLFRAAIKLKERTARAYFGLSRIYTAAAMHHTARLLLMRAHEIDPDDALITRSWLFLAPPEKRRELFVPFATAHPWLFENLQRQIANMAFVSKERQGRTLFELEGTREETTLHLVPLMATGTRMRGLGLVFTMAGQRPLHLLFDTGASGILVKQSAIDKAGLEHLGSSEERGIGDAGSRNGFLAIADSCQIDSMRMHTCLIRAVEGSKRIAGEEDGLIGADIFSDYLIEIDFLRHKLHLTPQSSRVSNPQGYDSPGPHDGFVRIFNFSDHLYVPTNLNGKSWGLFMLDTGSVDSFVDAEFARLSTKVHGNSFMHVHGISGEVKDVFEADKAELTFAGYRQSNLGLIAFNLNNSTHHEDVRIAGILGFPVLTLFRLTLDYRNGLAKFDYVYAGKKKRD